MPQRQFWADRHPCTFKAEYRFDATDPDERPALTVWVTDQAGEWMDFGHARVPHNVIHEAVTELLQAGWEAYLFGETGDVRQSVKAVLRRWERESLNRQRS